MQFHIEALERVNYDSTCAFKGEKKKEKKKIEQRRAPYRKLATFSDKISTLSAQR